MHDDNTRDARTVEDRDAALREVCAKLAVAKLVVGSLSRRYDELKRDKDARLRRSRRIPEMEPPITLQLVEEVTPREDTNDLPAWMVGHLPEPHARLSCALNGGEGVGAARAEKD